MCVYIYMCIYIYIHTHTYSWRRVLTGPLDCKEIKPANSKEINPEYSLEGLMLNWKG